MSASQPIGVAVCLPAHRNLIDGAFRKAFPKFAFHNAPSVEELGRVLPSCEILLINNTRYSPEVSRMAACHAPRLKWIQFTTVGIDTAAASGLPPGVMITNMRGVRSEVIASHAMALMLGVMRGVCHFQNMRSRRQWIRDAMNPYVRALEEATLVILGLGGIGRNIAQKARAFEMRVIGVSHRDEADLFFDDVVPRQKLHEVLPLADALVLCLPLNEQTRHILGEKELAMMKPEAVVVNIARGGLIDEQALIRSLQEGRLAGAGLDVVENEPLSPESPLWEMENVLLSPHIGGRGGTAQNRRFAELLSENLRRYQNGQKLQNLVDPRTGVVSNKSVSAGENPSGRLNR